MLPPSAGNHNNLTAGKAAKGFKRDHQPGSEEQRESTDPVIRGVSPGNPCNYLIFFIRILDKDKNENFENKS
jgi:hypothetical protein